ncbi:TonB-dependent receptor [Bacteroidetes/Chlorobi group bacterium ChocPot_Mid]|nr:MAG: TonB-dependent receptor [Bacteroidetes/Chlorobi group bacterium ChocPot_Mid]
MKKLLLIVLLSLLYFNYLLSQEEQSSTNKGTISGSVISKTTQQPLQSITVRVLNTNFGAFTDSKGKFQINNIPNGTYSVQFTGIGFEKYVQTDVMVNSAMPRKLEIQLVDKVIELQGAEVRASYFIKNAETVTSTQSLSYEDIRRSPGAQEDVIRATALLPGVAVTSAGRNDLIVRGGAPFENLFVVDNIEIPNINHFGSQGATGGPLSIINIDFVRDVSFSSGGFGSKYGNKVSSLTNIQLRNGNEDMFGGKVNLSATGFGLGLEGPVGNSGSFLFSARRSYLDLIFKAAGFSFIPEYWDFQTKIHYDINSNNSLSFLGIGALNTVSLNNETLDDRYGNSRVQVPNQNQYFSGFTWQTLFKDGFGRFTLGRTFTTFNTSQKDSNLVEIFKNLSDEGETSLKTDFEFKINTEMDIMLGNQIKYASKLTYDINIPGYIRTDNNGIPQELKVDTSFTSLKNSSYLSLTTAIGNHKVTLGGRLDYYDMTEPKFYFSPRLSVIYQLNDVSAITFSAGRYYQAPSFIWLVGGSTEPMKAIQADQLVMGYDHTPMEDLKVQLEVYYKWYSNYPGRVWRPQAVLAPAGFDDINNDIPYGLEPLSMTAKGYSRGAELFIQKKLSDIPLYGLLSITYSDTKFTSLDGIERVGTYDSRFIFNLSLGYKFNYDWEVATKFRASTGLPTTPYLTNGKLDYSKYNEGERLPFFHALDLRVDKKWNFSKMALTTYIDIQNIYGRKNVSQIRWNPRLNAPEYGASLGILPSIGINLEF